MYYTTEQFVLIQKLDNEAIKNEIKKAENKLEEFKMSYTKLEEDMFEESPLLAPDMNILFSGIRNIEGYIRLAENLLEEWDSNMYLNKKRLNRIKSLKKSGKVVEITGYNNSNTIRDINIKRNKLIVR